MDIIFDIHFLLPLVALITAMVLAFRTWKFRDRPLAGTFLILMLALAVWSFSAVLEYASPSLPAKTFWIYFSYFGVVTVPVAWFIFCLQYTNREKWIRRRNILLLCIMPIITLILVWTNSIHHLIWKDIWLNSETLPTTDAVTHGIWFWVHAAYAYSLLLLGTANLFSLMRQTAQAYRKQFSIIFFATLIPWAGNALYLAGLPVFATVDPTPLAFAATGVLFYWGLSRFHLIEIMPVAHDVVFNSIRDAVMLLNSERQIIDFNLAARGILVKEHGDVIGVPVDSVIPQLSGIVTASLPENGVKISFSMKAGLEQRIFDTFISEIKSRNRSKGYLLILHDNTESYKAEISNRERIVLETELTERRKAAEIVQYRLYLEQTMVGISSRFVTAIDIDAAINESLSDIGHLSKASRAYLFRMSANGTSMNNTHEWCAPGVENNTPKLQQLPVDAFPWWVANLSEGETIRIPDLDQMPQEAAAEKRFLESLHIRSAVALPLRGKGKLLGFMGIDNITNSSTWTEKDLSVLRVSAEIIGSALERYEASQELAKLNETLSRMNAQLEARVDERTRQLAETVVEANAANQAKSDFLASMSHELRTPLNAVIGFSQVLDEQIFGSLNQKQAEYVTNILSSGQHLLCLINDILDLSKIEAGKSQLELSEGKIGPLVQDSLLMIKEKAAKKHVELRTDLSPSAEASELQVDIRKIKQVLFNLLSNAVKFTPDDGAISVEATRRNGHLLVSVSDTGIGIPAEAQGKLFTDFYQVQGGLLSKTPGTGLGLAISKRLIEMHGGSIWVKSDGSNKGSTFAFEIPVRQLKGEQN
jgi:signal transduction histidine kinase